MSTTPIPWSGRPPTCILVTIACVDLLATKLLAAKVQLKNFVIDG